MGDLVGGTYSKDWFSRPELKAEFKKKNGHDLAPPKTWDEFKRVAEFFQGREIDGKKVYGAYIFTERGCEGITMGDGKVKSGPGAKALIDSKRADCSNYNLDSSLSYSLWGPIQNQITTPCLRTPKARQSRSIRTE